MKISRIVTFVLIGAFAFYVGYERGGYVERQKSHVDRMTLCNRAMEAYIDAVRRADREASILRSAAVGICDAVGFEIQQP